MSLTNSTINAPTSSTTNAVPKFSDTSGNNVSDTSVTIDASNNLATSGTVIGSNIDATNKSSVDAASAHVAASSGVHGITGSVVGDVDAQTLTNKTLDTDTLTFQSSSGLVGPSFSGQLLINTTGIAPAKMATFAFNVPGPVQPTYTFPSGIMNVVGDVTSQILTNKKLSDTTTTIVNVTTPTKVAAFDMSAVTASTTTTFKPLSTASRTIQFPDATDTVMLNTVLATVRTKFVQDGGAGAGGIEYFNNADSSKRLVFDLSGSTASTTTTIKTAAAAATNITLPTVTATLVGQATTDTLTNKTFDDSPNLKEIAAPATPATNYGRIYFKTDHNLYALDSTGLETQITGVSTSGLTQANALKLASFRG